MSDTLDDWFCLKILPHEDVLMGYIHRVWFANIPGGWAWGVPRAELLFALTMGMFWSGIYEQVLWLFTFPLPKRRMLLLPDEVMSNLLCGGAWRATHVAQPPSAVFCHEEPSNFG